MKKLYFLLTLSYLTLTACGQSGPLYLPSEQVQQSPEQTSVQEAPIPTAQGRERHNMSVEL